MKREVAGQMLAKSMIGLSLIGASALWVLDSYVEVDVMQQATASVADESGTLSPVLDDSGQPVQLAQTVRGNVKLNRVKIGPGLKETQEPADKPLIPIEPFSTKYFISFLLIENFTNQVLPTLLIFNIFEVESICPCK